MAVSALCTLSGPVTRHYRTTAFRSSTHRDAAQIRSQPQCSVQEPNHSSKLAEIKDKECSRRPLECSTFSSERKLNCSCQRKSRGWRIFLNFSSCFWRPLNEHGKPWTLAGLGPGCEGHVDHSMSVGGCVDGSDSGLSARLQADALTNRQRFCIYCTFVYLPYLFLHSA